MAVCFEERFNRSDFILISQTVLMIRGNYLVDECARGAVEDLAPTICMKIIASDINLFFHYKFIDIESCLASQNLKTWGR